MTNGRPAPPKAVANFFSRREPDDVGGPGLHELIAHHDEPVGGHPAEGGEGGIEVLGPEHVDEADGALLGDGGPLERASVLPDGRISRAPQDGDA